MSRHNHDNDDKGLLIMGIILLFTGIGSGLGGLLLAIYFIKKFANNKNIDNSFSYNIRKNISESIKNAMNNSGFSNYNNSEVDNNDKAKVIYAEKVETVENKTDVKKETVVKEATPVSDGYTNQDILDKLDYYNQHTDLTNDEILEKISVLNKMLSNLATRIDKEELQNDIKDINKTIDKILKTLKKKKSKIKKINNFTTYYLPVTLKILIKYDEVENLKLNSANSNEFMSTVEDKIKMIKTSFTNQLESLYADDFDDVEAELNVLETMLKSDGYTDLDDFNLRKKQ